MYPARLLAVAVSFLLALPAFAQAPPERWPHWNEAAQGPRIGVMVEDLSFRELDALDLPYGVRVTRAVPGSPAAAAGIRAGDIFLHFDTRPVFSVARLQWLTGQAPAGGTIVLRYYRDGNIADVELSFDAPPAASAPPPDAAREWVWKSPDYLGASLQSLTTGLREALAVPDGLGALVSEVYANSPAERAGLRAGDVIVKMDRRVILDIGDVERVLDYFETGEQLSLEVIREKQALQLTLTLGERRERPGFRHRDRWPDPDSDRLPFFDPDWWRELEDFTERWRHYWEQEQPERTPRGAL